MAADAAAKAASQCSTIDGRTLSSSSSSTLTAASGRSLFLQEGEEGALILPELQIFVSQDAALRRHPPMARISATRVSDERGIDEGWKCNEIQRMKGDEG